MAQCGPLKAIHLGRYIGDGSVGEGPTHVSGAAFRQGFKLGNRARCAGVLCRFASGRTRVFDRPSATSVWMVVRVAYRTPHKRASPQPPVSSGVRHNKKTCCLRLRPPHRNVPRIGDKPQLARG
jgi:hypothetical protein